MQITAKYKGKDNKKGYKNGQQYRLLFNTVNVFGTFKERIEINNIRINDWDKNSTVLYTSLKKFLNNWEVI